MGGSRAPGVKKLSPTNWNTREATDLSDRLYHLLEKVICNEFPTHTVELQLDGFKLDESCVKNCLVQDMLTSSCPTGNGRQQCHCISILG